MAGRQGFVPRPASLASRPKPESANQPRTEAKLE